ncbi:MAG TPA: pitrilysin family protein [Pyrinomonadaceae bacterium]|nr:pitrilysin family protein [Pyrinomonadaceae bacterium]
MKHLRKLVPLTLSLSLVMANGLAALAQSSPKANAARSVTAQAPPQTYPKLNFEKYKLKNGLDVILVEDHRLPLVAVNLWYHVGPANEKAGRTGFAHLFEHMMFQGSKHVGDDAHFKLLEGAGASDINGTTGFDRTNYFETLPSNQLELALWLESDRMGYLLDTLDNRKLANQRDVVRNERRQSRENVPYGLVNEGLYHQLFPKTHPYYGVVIGSHADIEAARLADVREFFKLYYTPNNASLAIVGDIDKTKARALVEKYFGPIPPGQPVPKIEAVTPAITSERRAVVTDQVELPRVYMAWITDPIYKPGNAEADLLARILGGGKYSRLYKRLVYDRQIAQDVNAFNQSTLLGSVFIIQATAKPGVKPEELEKAIDEELEAVRREGPTEGEVERARNLIQTQIVRGLETLGGFGGVADRLNQYNHYLGDPDYLAKDLDRYEKATPAAIQKIAREKLSNSARAVVYGVPGKKVIDDVPKTAEEEKDATPAAGDSSQDDWRKQQPGAAALSKLSLPVPKKFTLPNGLSVLLVEQHNLPMVSAALVVLSGSEANPVDKPGLASFTADILDEGTGKRSALQIADDAGQIGATFFTGSSSDASTVNVSSLKKNADAAFELMADVALNPTFPQKEIDRVRNTRLTLIQQQRDNPNAIAARVFNNVVYGEKHPYGFTELGTAESTKSITRDDMMSFWKKGFVPGNSALVVAGDITEKEVRALAEKHFGNWTGKPIQFAMTSFESSAKRQVVIVDKPGAPQTALRIGHVGVPRSSPDYVPLEVMNLGLGGLFSSRINMNLREKNGYTYGAFSTFEYRRGQGPFYAGSGVRTNVTAPAVKEVFNELDRMRTTRMTDDELQTAKDALARSLAGPFETTGRTVGAISDLFVYNLPLDFYNTLPSRIGAVTAADVQRVAEKYLKPDSTVVIAVGDRSKIEPELQKLNLGPVETRDLDGKPTP